MKKRFSTRLIAFLIVLISTVLLIPGSAMAAGTDGVATVVKSYNKDGKFSIVIDLTFPENGICTFEIFLTDAGGDVISRWDTIPGTFTFGTRQYTFSRSYADTPDGTYTMNVVATNAYGNSVNYAWTINHKKVTSLTYKDTYKVKNDDGTYSQMFTFSSVNGKGKTYYFELYTKDGSYVKSFSCYDNYNKSNVRIKWNYYPESGLRMKSGTYIIKYWPDGGNPKEATVDITI